jgi:hypothetical protein
MIKTTLNNNTTTTNQRQCTCKKCGRILQAGEGIKVYARNKNAFLCAYCSRVNQGGYSTENTTFENNKTKTNNCTISVELEISNNARNYTTEQKLQWLTNEAKFIKTPDGSVWYEFKSPIYNNLLGMSKVLHNFEKLNNLSQWNNASDYGTHLNIGNTELTEEKMLIIRRFYHSLFVPFSDYLKQNPQKTITLYGRNFTHYAQALNYNSPVPSTFGGDYMESAHCNFINIQHKTHIEFRLAKLVTAKQYLICARCHQDIIQKVICDYFLTRYNEGMTATAKRQLANKASQKMIKTFEKYYNKLAN